MPPDHKYPGPQDTPKYYNAEKYRQLISPAIQQAKTTLPEALGRFNSPPDGYTFYVTVILRDDNGQEENAFIKVLACGNGNVAGLLATKMTLVSGYKYGVRIMVLENEVIDWTITSPDGQEEGNYIGKLLDGVKR